MAQRKQGEKKINFKVDEIIKDKVFYAILNQHPNSVKGDDELSKDDLVDFIMWAVNPQDFPLTHRTIKYLLTYVKLSKDFNGIYDGKTYPEEYGRGTKHGGDGYIHHDVAKDVAKINYGITYTSYSKLAQKSPEPYRFLEPKVRQNNLVDRDGCFKPTQYCLDYLHGEFGVTERIIIIKNEVVWQSKTLLKAAEAMSIKMSFKEAVAVFNEIIL